jgi:hypothetical protein
MSALVKRRKKNVSSGATWTAQERFFLKTVHPIFGDDWKLYAKYLPGRTPGAIRTQWHWMNNVRVRKVKKCEEEEEEDWSFLEFNF